VRLLPALSLFLLAPLAAEFLLGNLPITALFSLVLLAPLYGGGALLIREVARRTGRGWPTILLLGLAYGILEEGVTTQSLFNPDYAGQRLLDHGFVPGLGIAVPWTLFVLTLHTVWSIATPIALVETIVRRPGPWPRSAPWPRSCCPGGSGPPRCGRPTRRSCWAWPWPPVLRSSSCR
jgi:hypothetical protein